MVSPDLNLLNKFSYQKFSADFPALKTPTIYLDSAATALKPEAMIKATEQYYAENTASAHRGIYQEALIINQTIDHTRQQVANLIGTNETDAIIWTRGTTESINMIAQCYARPLLQKGDEIIVSVLEHHSNLLPWLIVAKQCGANVVEWSSSVEDLQKLISMRTKIVAITQMSNVTGFCPALAQISQIVHQQNAKLVVDGAQGIVHHPIDVMQLDIDFYVFSAHKLYGPTGLGILYAKKPLLEAMAVWQGGGKMLKTVSFNGFEVADLPNKFEAGTPNIAGILGFSATLDWLVQWDRQQCNEYTEQLVDYAMRKLRQFTAIEFYNVAQSPIITFNLPPIHHQDLAILLSEQNIAVRTGQFCAHPLIQKLGISGAIRLSLMPYNCLDDIDKFIDALQEAYSLLS